MTAIEWDVFSLAPGGSSDPPTYLATLYEAREKTIRVELHGSGSGSFAINRHSPECTEAILAQGNLVKIRIPEIHSDYIFAFFLETGDFTLISSDEKGGEMLHFGGRGNLTYLANGITWSHTFIGTDVFNKDGLWRAYAEGFGTAPGQLLRLMIDEYQHVDRPQQPIPLLTPDFDYTVDSNGDAWATDTATAEFTVPVGDDGLATLQRLLDTGRITVQMDPDFTLHAYNSLGRDLAGDAFGTGVVRFERGVNIAVELRREVQPSIVASHELIAGETGHYGAAALPDQALRVTREVFNTAFGVTSTPLNRLALADLKERLKQSDTIMFPINNRRTADVVLSDPVSIGSALGPVATDGNYLPGPPGSDNGDFWVGDTVRVHTGSEAFDYDEVDAVVEAITITREDEAHELTIIPELKTLPAEHTEVVAVFLSNTSIPFWPTGWTQLDSLAFRRGSTSVDYFYITIAKGPPGATSVQACATDPCGGSNFGNSSALMVFEILNTTGFLGISSHGDPGGSFVFPDVVMDGPGLLLAPMMRWASSTPRNDPDTADGWSNVTRIRGTSATSKNLGALGSSETFTTQSGLLFQYAGQHSTIYFVSRANPANYMVGFITAYSGTSLTVEPYRIFGSGTHSDWDIYLGFNSFNDLGDRDYVNAEYQVVSAPGTYGGTEAAAGSCFVVTLAFEGPNAALGRVGFSGLDILGASATVLIA